MKQFESEMLALPDMESLGLFLNKDIHRLSSEEMTRVIQSAWQMPDLVAKLETFETEYRVMHELRSTFNKNWMDMSDLESRNKALSEQNDELIQQLALCRGAIMRQEIATSVLQRLVDKQQDRLERYGTTHKCVLCFNHVSTFTMISLNRTHGFYFFGHPCPAGSIQGRFQLEGSF